jgi:hypothetical protein
MTRTMLRGIRVASKQELIDRIHVGTPFLRGQQQSSGSHTQTPYRKSLTIR